MATFCEQLMSKNVAMDVANAIADGVSSSLVIIIIPPPSVVDVTNGIVGWYSYWTVYFGTYYG